MLQFIVIELLEHSCGEIGQPDIPQGRFEMIFGIAVVAVIGGLLQAVPHVNSQPQVQPFAQCHVADLDLIGPILKTELVK